MKNNLLKVIFPLLLCIVCLMFATACNEPGTQQPEDLDGGTVTDLNGSLQGLNASAVQPYTFYIKIDGIDGEAKDSNHDKWIETISFSHESSQTIQNAVDSASTSEYLPFVFTHKVDKATPKINESCMKGTVIKKVELEAMVSAAGKAQLSYKVTLETAKIVDAKVYSVTTESGASYLVEDVKIIANKQTWSYTSIGLDNSQGGKTEANYDQSKKV